MIENSIEEMQVEESIKRKNSGFGVASFIMSISVGILIFVVFAIAGIMSATTPGGMDKQSIQTMVIGFAIIALLFCAVISMALGIVGLFQKDRKKLFAILGTIFSSVILIATAALMILGIMVNRNAL